MCRYLDGVHVDLKGSSDETYAQAQLGQAGADAGDHQDAAAGEVWFEVINLVVPTYTDEPEVDPRDVPLAGGPRWGRTARCTSRVSCRRTS